MCVRATHQVGEEEEDGEAAYRDEYRHDRDGRLVVHVLYPRRAMQIIGRAAGTAGRRGGAGFEPVRVGQQLLELLYDCGLCCWQERRGGRCQVGRRHLSLAQSNRLKMAKRVAGCRLPRGH